MVVEAVESVAWLQVVIDEPIPSGQILFYIHANDDDAGDLGHITFNVTNDGSRHRGNDCLPPDGMFVIDDLTGAVKAVVESVERDVLSMDFYCNLYQSRKDLVEAP